MTFLLLVVLQLLFKTYLYQEADSGKNFVVSFLTKMSLCFGPGGLYVEERFLIQKIYQLSVDFPPIIILFPILKNMYMLHPIIFMGAEVKAKNLFT